MLLFSALCYFIVAADDMRWRDAETRAFIRAARARASGRARKSALPATVKYRSSTTTGHHGHESFLAGCAPSMSAQNAAWSRRGCWRLITAQVMPLVVARRSSSAILRQRTEVVPVIFRGHQPLAQRSCHATIIAGSIRVTSFSAISATAADAMPALPPDFDYHAYFIYAAAIHDSGECRCASKEAGITRRLVIAMIRLTLFKTPAAHADTSRAAAIFARRYFHAATIFYAAPACQHTSDMIRR